MFLKDGYITALLLWWAICCCTAVGRGQGSQDYGRALEDWRRVQGPPAHAGLPRLLRNSIMSEALQHLLVCQGSKESAMCPGLSSGGWSAKAREDPRCVQGFCSLCVCHQNLERIVVIIGACRMVVIKASDVSVKSLGNVKSSYSCELCRDL